MIKQRRLSVSTVIAECVPEAPSRTGLLLANVADVGGAEARIYNRGVDYEGGLPIFPFSWIYLGPDDDCDKQWFIKTPTSYTRVHVIEFYKEKRR